MRKMESKKRFEGRDKVEVDLRTIRRESLLEKREENDLDSERGVLRDGAPVRNAIFQKRKRTFKSNTGIGEGRAGISPKKCHRGGVIGEDRKMGSQIRRSSSVTVGGTPPHAR